jgi:hypothetical protein
MDRKRTSDLNANLFNCIQVTPPIKHGKVGGKAGNGMKILMKEGPAKRYVSYIIHTCDET